MDFFLVIPSDGHCRHQRAEESRIFCNFSL
jgi:hypothetical protein